jgi:SAM-dependent methyltransferase
MQAHLMRFKPSLRKAPGYGIARLVWSLVKSTESRHAALLLLRPPRGLYQPYGTTSIDRYPEIFRFVRESVGDSAALRVLSFGCATGEEVFTLRRYFPLATLAGIDINPWNIALCRLRRSKVRKEKMTFAVAGSATGEADSSYDAIFAMAVFRHGDLNTSQPAASSSRRIRFADFEESVADLARVLKPGGLLAIQNAMFRFCDTRVAGDFATVFTMKREEPAPLYGPDDCLLPDAKYPDIVFRKIR